MIGGIEETSASFEARSAPRSYPTAGGRAMKRASLPLQRREFIAFLCGAVASPNTVLAEGKNRRPVIAWLATASQNDSSYYIRPFLEGMRELGYTEGRDFDIVSRFADGHNDRLPRLAAELVQLNPDIFFAGATAQAVVVKKITTTIPIVVAAPLIVRPSQRSFETYSLL